MRVIFDIKWGLCLARLSDDSKSAIEDGGDKPLHVAANDADHNEQCVHVITKIFHSIRGESCWKDFLLSWPNVVLIFFFRTPF